MGSSVFECSFLEGAEVVTVQSPAVSLWWTELVANLR